MLRTNKLRLLSRFLILAVLLGGVVLVGTDEKRTASAATAECCYTCEAKFRKCQLTNSTAYCSSTLNYCFNHCIQCEYEGGSSCNGPEDCIDGNCVFPQGGGTGYCQPY